MTSPLFLLETASEILLWKKLSYKHFKNLGLIYTPSTSTNTVAYLFNISYAFLPSLVEISMLFSLYFVSLWKVFYKAPVIAQCNFKFLIQSFVLLITSTVFTHQNIFNYWRTILCIIYYLGFFYIKFTINIKYITRKAWEKIRT